MKSMKKTIMACVAFLLLLCGCSSAKAEQEYPTYFQPAVTQLEAAFEEWGENQKGQPFYDFFEPAFRDFGLSCVGSAKDGIFRCCKGGACWVFDLSEQYNAVAGEEEYYWWNPVAIYQAEGEERVYISWSASGTPPTDDTPQFLLLSFPAGRPWEREARFFQKPPIGGEGFWEPSCCLVGDDFYFMDWSDTIAFNMQTGELRDIYPKLGVVGNCAVRFMGEKDLEHTGINGFLYEQDGVEVYCAYVDDDWDEMEGYVFVAFQDGEPIACMGADVSGEALRIEMIEVDESGAGGGINDEMIVQIEAAWDYVDVEIPNLPKGAVVHVITEKGVYYETVKGTENSEAEQTLEKEFHFLDYSGNDQILLHKKVSYAYNYTTMKAGDHMILCDSTGEGIEVIRLSSEGDIETLFTQTSPRVPNIQSHGRYVASIRHNDTADSDMMEHTLVLRDTVSGVEKVIYSALMDYQKGIGEIVGCVSMNDETVCFTLNKGYGDKESETTLCLYDIGSEEIVGEIPLRTRAYYAAYGGAEAGLLLSGMTGFKAGSVGRIEDGAYVEMSKIPLISTSIMIQDGIYTEGGYYFTTYHAAYYWDTRANKVYVYDYQWAENKKSRVSLSENGVAYVLRDGERTVIRTMSVNRD
ncbi:MAG: hypothetical protein NC413_07705 [Muribaculum sp.]|nr:hypothetical protein [Muribaculum sp.]